MKSLIAPILFWLMILSVASAQDVKTTVAKVDYGEIEYLLLKVVLNSEGNEELSERFHAKKKAAKEAQEKLQAAIMKGEGFNPMDAASSHLYDDVDQKKVEQLCQKQLLEIIEQVFSGKYDIVFKDDYRSSLIYAKSAIDDVTIVIKQELLKSIPKNWLEKNKVLNLMA